ncbi:MAG: TIGR03546 family protein [Halobacteriovoraceae bacterium]|jgi:uncharacterized protein (TIGR03546 family)|nr:TIGR03546 family protein [Halobacteriovoraceae bacterium]MBC98702.1 TIGR03546 family protein [Halobacteriovoraceae bacterium]|tara:strand:- start:15 stop:539 length:525 start_codon:yes stop_codon:yes gene_type:complete
MTLILKQIFTLLKLLNSETETNQIAAGVSFGFILGMTPALSLQTLLIFFLCLLFRIQLGAMFVSLFFFSFIAFILDPLFHSAGLFVLQLDSLQGIFTTLYNLPIIPMTRFYNTLVMGSGVISIILSPFVFITSKILIVKYRKSVVERFKDTKFFKALKATSFYKWYYKYDSLYG